MIPNNITEQNVLEAINDFNKNGIRYPLAKSKKFDLVFNNQTYPPKYIISLANEYANKVYLSHQDFDTYEAQKYLKNLSPNFIIIKKLEIDPILDLIEKYKVHIRNGGLDDEMYKWDLLSKFRGRPDSNASDFESEIKNIKFENLIYPMSSAVLTHITKKKTGALRECFKSLFDENIPLLTRLKNFNVKTLEIYREIDPESKKSHHQDERTMATYLTYHNPDKYTFYKDSFYQKYCQLLGIKVYKTGEKYVHYLELINDLVNEYINDDQELLDLVQEKIKNLEFQDVNHKLLAQDILYQMLEKTTKTDVNYWIFQGSPKIYDIVSAITDNALETWSVKNHKDKIKTGDKIILWVTGDNPGCYALAEVTSEVFEDFDNEKEIKYYRDNHTNEKSPQVKIKITHNLVSNPITKEMIKDIEELSNLKVGNQGTNFQATEKEYLRIKDMAEPKEKKYWLYAPGEGAKMWDEFYKNGIMGLGWDKLGDLNNYKTQKEIATKLQELENTSSNKVNDSLANWEFKNSISIGDIIIVKKGQKELVGYGEVKSDYYFNNEYDHYKSCRKVDWKLKGNWKVDDNLHVKTLTDITKYPDGNSETDKYYERLLRIMMHPKTYPLNTILYGPPGTGKTYHTILRAAEIIESREIKDYSEALNIFNSNLGDRIEFITFHQNYSYEDFIQGLRPDVESDGDLCFERKDGVFKRIADRALKNILDSLKPNDIKRKFDDVFNEYILPLNLGEVEELEVKMKKVSYYITSIGHKSIEFRKNDGESKHSLSIETLRKMYDKGSNEFIIGGLQPYYNPILAILLDKGKTNVTQVNKQNYVIIIDEINRANISRVFGELITLIEPDKRSHGAIPLKCTLPSGEEFIVPSNLHLIGTMNTADKSIALLDIALRRRFEFESMYPRYEIEGCEIHDIEILQKINERIKVLKGYDFQIGHSYFMGDDYKLIERMNKKVIPLLLEYFMNDEKEVRGILVNAGLSIETDSWPLKVIGLL